MQWFGGCTIFGYGSKPRTPSEHPNPHQNKLRWVVDLPQNGTIGVDPRPYLRIKFNPSPSTASAIDARVQAADEVEQPMVSVPQGVPLSFPQGRIWRSLGTGLTKEVVQCQKSSKIVFYFLDKVFGDILLNQLDPLE